jgi:hypothetical protein
MLFSEVVEEGYRTYLRKTDGSPAVRLGDGASQALSPDGLWAVALRVETDDLVLLPTGVGDMRILPRGSVTTIEAPVRWLPDGRRLLFMGSEDGFDEPGIYLVDVRQGAPKRVSPQGSWVLRWAAPFDDRSYTALPGGEVDTGTAAIVPLDGGPPVPIAGLEPGDVPLQWSVGGRIVYFWRPGAIPAEVFKLDTTTRQRELWRTISPPDRTGLRTIRLVLPTPDGKYYVYDYERTLSDLYLVTGIR